jgi:hypothetical protein
MLLCASRIRKEIRQVILDPYEADPQQINNS